MKKQLKDEGANEVYEKIVQLKMIAPDGKKRMTDVANTEQILRIIQSIPSPKAEPFKLWLAQVGRERIEETIIISKSLCTDVCAEAFFLWQLFCFSH